MGGLEMRGPGIHVELPRAVSRAASRVGGEDAPEKGRSAPPVAFYGQDGRQFKRPAIQGLATSYGKPVLNEDGAFVVFQSGCFISAIYDNTRKRVLLDHDDSQEVGSTNDGLEFANTLDGLAFRMPLKGSGAHIIGVNISNGERLAISIGSSFIEREEKIIDRHKVKLVTKATINEISLCRDPKFADAYATIVDLDEEPADLWTAARQPRFKTDGAVNKALRSLARIEEALARL